MSGETKTRTGPFLVGLAVGVLVTAAFLGRYRIVGAATSTSAAAYRLDSWTGEMVVVGQTVMYRVTPKQDEASKLLPMLIFLVPR